MLMDLPVTFKSEVLTSMNMDNINHMFRTVPEQIFQQMEDYESNGSGWVVDHFFGVDLGILTHDLLWASSYISTPKGLKYKKAIVIIKNSDQKCFTWSDLGKLYPQPNISHKVSPYERLEYNLGMAGIDYPIRTNDIKKFLQFTPALLLTFTDMKMKLCSPSEYQIFMTDYTVLIWEHHYILIKDFSQRISKQYCMGNGKLFFVASVCVDSSETHRVMYKSWSAASHTSQENWTW